MLCHSLQEAMRMQLLRHPHIVVFYGMSLDGNRGTLLLEFCEGRDLQTVLGLRAAGSNERLFGWYRNGLRVATEVAKALNYLHSRVRLPGAVWAEGEG